MHSVKQFILGPEQEFLAVSREIHPVDLSEIHNWSADSGELCSASPMAYSWNFHPLPSGKFCLSRTGRLVVLLPAEDSEKVFTHGIIVPPELLKDYANNPICFFKHLDKLGLWRAGIEVTRQLLETNPSSRPNSSQFPHAEILPVLRTLSIDGGTEAVRLNSLQSFLHSTGIRRFATILDQILGNCTTIITGNTLGELLLEALLDVLPVSSRTHFSFSTGLKFSQKRLFRIVFIGTEVKEQERIRRHFNLPIISSSSVTAIQDQLLPTLKNRWAMFIATVFEQNLGAAWNEIVLLDDTQNLNELSRRARYWFKKLGLEEIYQKIRENHRSISWTGNEAYGILQARTQNVSNALNLLRPLIPESNKETPLSGSTSKEKETFPRPAIQRYLDALSEAMHGNPLAQDHLKLVFDEITESVPEYSKNEASEILLREGVRCWNEEHVSKPNQSWRQVEGMVDTLSTMLNLCSEPEDREPHRSNSQ